MVRPLHCLRRHHPEVSSGRKLRQLFFEACHALARIPSESVVQFIFRPPANVHRELPLRQQIGGIAGPALALFLNKAGIASTVFEAYSQVDDIGGGLQISPNGMRVLEQIGISDEVIARGIESDEVSFENQRGKVLGRTPNGPARIYGIPP